MKIKQHNTVGISSNIVDADVKSFSMKNVGKVMSVFRDNMYKHKFRTMVQEYTSNARDGVREKIMNRLKFEGKISGKDNANLVKINEEYSKLQKHIEITAPTELDLFFRVRDYGVGISPDRMHNVFLDFGSSTKDDNYQTGGFGLGSKIGFAVSDSFNITSIFNGVKYEYLATIANSQNGELITISTSKTNEPDGVLIEVPVPMDKISLVKDSIDRAVYFWDIKPVTLNHNIIDNQLDNIFNNETSTIITNTDIIHKLQKNVLTEATKHFAILDGIVYPITNDFFKCQGFDSLMTLITTSTTIIHYFGIGELDIIANREELAMTESNKKIINERFFKTANDLKRKISDELNKTQEDYKLFLKTLHYWNSETLFFKNKPKEHSEIVELDFWKHNDWMTLKRIDSGLVAYYTKPNMLGYFQLVSARSKKTLFKKYGNDLSISKKVCFFHTNEQMSDNLIRQKVKSYLTSNCVYEYAIIYDGAMTQDNHKQYFNSVDLATVEILKESKETKTVNISDKKPRSKNVIRFRFIESYGLGNLHNQSADHFSPNTVYCLSTDKYPIALAESWNEVVNAIKPHLKGTYSFIFIEGDREKNLEKVGGNTNLISITDLVKNIEQCVNIESILYHKAVNAIRSKMAPISMITANKNLKKMMDRSVEIRELLSEFHNVMRAVEAKIVIDIKNYKPIDLIFSTLSEKSKKEGAKIQKQLEKDTANYFNFIERNQLLTVIDYDRIVNREFLDIYLNEMVRYAR